MKSSEPSAHHTPKPQHLLEHEHTHIHTDTQAHTAPNVNGVTTLRRPYEIIPCNHPAAVRLLHQSMSSCCGNGWLCLCVCASDRPTDAAVAGDDADVICLGGLVVGVVVASASE